MLSRVEPEKSFTSEGPGFLRIKPTLYSCLHIQIHQPGLEVIKLVSCSTEREIDPAHKC